jgi:myo-inositol 2-dehydrogenase/D-chiro-inositol 1-dehydrogenase
MQPKQDPSSVSRRTFVAAAAAASAFTIVQPSAVRSAAANSVIELGLIGCGGRGSWITKLFTETGKYRFVACADYFQDRVDAVGEEHKIDKPRRHTGLSGYKKLLASKLDAVVIETPPVFHPQQAMDAVDADKHVYCAKPIAIDAPGCLTISAAGKKATEKKLVFLVDFQTRANEHYRECLRRVRNGDIGRIVMGDARYPWSGGGRAEPSTNPEERLRNWYHAVEISGDFIVEQSIHSLDVATWILDADPVSAVGFGGRKVRPAKGIYDHFAITYAFPDKVLLNFNCIQSIPAVIDEIRARVYGSDGYIDTDYYSDVMVRGKQFYRGRNNNLYTTGTQVNIQEFHQAIVEGKTDNPTVAPSVRSNLTAVLGRDAAYRGGELTLETLIKEGRKLEPDLKGLKA